MDSIFSGIPESAKISALEAIERDGIERVIIDYSNRMDHTSDKIAARLLLSKLYSNTAGTLLEYLGVVAPVMLALNEPDYASILETLSSTQGKPEFRIELEKFNREFDSLKPGSKQNATWNFMREHGDKIKLRHELDLNFSFHSLFIMMDSYLLNNRGVVVERPQFMYLRIASQLHGTSAGTSPEDITETIRKVQECYDELSQHFYVPASPTIFNAGTTYPQMSSCFLTSIDDNMISILNSYKSCGLISKYNGANGISLSKLRSGSHIGVAGKSRGVTPVMSVLDDITNQVDQGGKRSGATQLTLPVWHVDIQSFASKANQFKEDHVKHTHLCLMVNDLFLERVQDPEGMWSVFCPTDVPMLLKTYGDEFRSWYLKYEEMGLARKRFHAYTFYKEIANYRCTKSGMPFITSYDNINAKTNQSNIGDGIIHQSNLCLEIMLVADNDRIPSCNLSSDCLPKFVLPGPHFDYIKYGDIVRKEVRNLNSLLEYNYTVLPQIKKCNLESAPIGIGTQGFADLLAILDIPFDSKEAVDLTEKISACKYYNALYESCNIAKERGYAYPAFEGSPFSKGILQFDMNRSEGEKRSRKIRSIIEPTQWGQEGSWSQLKNDIMRYGVANSQLTTSQPTASCAQIVGASEAWEPYSFLFYVRNTKSRKYIEVNQYLREDFLELGLEERHLIHYLRANEGSVQGLADVYKSRVSDSIYDRLKFLERKYKIAHEIEQEVILIHAAVRSPYIDGSQSTSLYHKNPNPEKIIELDLFANNLGLKTLCYYSRERPGAKAISFTLEDLDLDVNAPTDEKLCQRNNPECLSCQ